jgi:phosphoserine phosphatase RsbU/P
MDSAHLLVVDDNELNRDMLARRIRQQGLTCDLAENGRQALDRLRTAAYDLVLLDIMMPEVDGYQVLEQVKADPALRHIPVIMISAIDEIENTARCIEMGADDYLTKPFNPTLLKARIRSSLEKKQLRDKEQLYAKSLEREMEIGRQIQSSFLPESLPVRAGWELQAVFQPARQVAGDFYDAFELGGKELIGLVTADVCDKGVGAALFMALFRTLIRSGAEANFAAAVEGEMSLWIEKTIAQVNEYIARTHSQANMFATVFFGVLDVRTGELVYVNGGHEPPLLRRAGGEQEQLEPTGPVVGALPEMVFESSRVTMLPGDVLVCYTDGVTEARSQEGEFFGMERLAALAGGEQISAALEAFTKGAEQNDDITLLVVGRR